MVCAAESFASNQGASVNERCSTKAGTEQPKGTLMNTYTTPHEPLAIQARAAQLGTKVTKTAVRSAIWAGQIGHVCIGRTRWTSDADIVAWIESHYVAPRQSAQAV